MNLTAWFFAIASLLGWCLWLAARHRAVRALRRLECQHKLALARKHIDSVRAGMMGERWRWQTILSGGVESRHAVSGGNNPGQIAGNSLPPSSGERIRNSGSSAPPAQTSLRDEVVSRMGYDPATTEAGPRLQRQVQEAARSLS